MTRYVFDRRGLDDAPYEKLVNKGVADGYLGLESSGFPAPQKISSDGYSGAGTKAYHDDGKWKVPGGGGSATTTEVEVDFGWPPRANRSFTVVDATVSGTSKILAWPSGNAATGQDADEFELTPFVCSARAGTGTFTLNVVACDQVIGRIGGRVRVFYQVA